MQLDIIFLKDFSSQFSTKWSYLESCYIDLKQLFNRICFAFFPCKTETLNMNGVNIG